MTRRGALTFVAALVCAVFIWAIAIWALVAS